LLITDTIHLQYAFPIQ